MADFDKSLGYNLLLSTRNFFIIIRHITGKQQQFPQKPTKNKVDISHSSTGRLMQEAVAPCAKLWHRVNSSLWAQVRAASESNLRSGTPTPRLKPKMYTLCLQHSHSHSHSHMLGTSIRRYRSWCHLFGYCESLGTPKASIKSGRLQIIFGSLLISQLYLIDASSFHSVKVE